MKRDMDAKQRIAKPFLRRLADLIWPARSLVGGGRGAGHGPLTADSFMAMHFITDPVCDRCGVPVQLDTGPGQICAACHAKPPRWDRARAALVYDAASRRVVLDLKRSGRRDGLATMGRWMVQAGGDLIDTADLIIPVPLHYLRLVSRGYNQSGWLAQVLGRQTGCAVGIDALKRVRHTKSQGGLNKRARERNMRSAFKVRRRWEERLKGARVVLVDDVLTTGATLAACTMVLKRAGAATVDVIVLSRVVREEDVTI